MKKSHSNSTRPADRAEALRNEQNRKMARSAHAYVRGNTVKFYEWLRTRRHRALPSGPPVWICGDCHVGNLGPVADADGRIDIQIRPTGLGALLDPAAALSPNATDGETQTLSVPVKLRRCGREIRMLVGTDPFATAKPDRRLIKLLIRACRFNAALAGSDGVPFAALAKQEGVSPSYFTRLVRLSYLAPDITQAILDGRQPRDLTAEKLLAHSRLPLAWRDQRAALGFA